MALTQELIDELKALRDEEDAGLWAFGDVVAPAALTKEEKQKLADELQIGLETLLSREEVAKETPKNKRRPEYAWTIYKEFARITNHDTRFREMFSRPDWTVRKWGRRG